MAIDVTSQVIQKTPINNESKRPNPREMFCTYIHISQTKRKNIAKGYVLQKLNENLNFKYKQPSVSAIRMVMILLLEPRFHLNIVGTIWLPPIF